MLIVGLTGSVASGKNLIAENFRKLGAAIFDADFEVHQIFEQNKKVFEQIRIHFPQVIINDKINRQKLGELTFNNKKNLAILEQIIHPLLQEKRQKFLQKMRSQKKRIVILNIPLLFEKNIYKNCHKNILVTAPLAIQKQRFLQRAKNNKTAFLEDLLLVKFKNILQNQMSNSEKIKLADFVINNGQNKAFTFWQTQKIFNQLITH